MADDDDKKGLKPSKTKAVSQDTIITPKGNVVTKQEWQKAKQNGLEFDSHQAYADYVDGYAHPIKDNTSTPQSTPQLKQNNRYERNGSISSGYSRYHQ